MRPQSGENGSLWYGKCTRKAFKEIKKELTNAPALGLPDVMKPFFLYVHERLGTAVEVLNQLLDSWHHRVAYLSKQLDTVSQGWPLCLCALAATTALGTEAEKLTSSFPTPS
jgi:hypothetical protein